MDAVVAIYDACVLYPDFLRNFLVRLAALGYQQDLLRAKWTGRIHREWIGAVLEQRPDLKRTALQRTRRLMDEHVPGCRVRGYQRWEGRLTLPDANDRHVLAAALACIADVIVTFNTRDFPSDLLGSFGMVAVPPDNFVCNFVQRDIVIAAATEHRASLSRPSMTVTAYLEALRRNGLPGVAAFLAAEEQGKETS